MLRLPPKKKTWKDRMEDMVLLGFQDGGPLFFRVGAERPQSVKDLAEVIRQVPSVNGFNAPKVARKLSKLVDEGLVAMAWFGREYSEVLYLEPKDPILLETLRKKVASLGMDECDVQPDGTLRLWWD